MVQTDTYSITVARASSGLVVGFRGPPGRHDVPREHRYSPVATLPSCVCFPVFFFFLPSPFFFHFNVILIVNVELRVGANFFVNDLVVVLNVLIKALLVQNVTPLGTGPSLLCSFSNSSRSLDTPPNFLSVQYVWKRFLLVSWLFGYAVLIKNFQNLIE